MSHTPSIPARLIGALLLLASALSGAAQSGDKIAFNIPGQSLSNALLEYSEATGIRIRES